LCIYGFDYNNEQNLCGTAKTGILKIHTHVISQVTYVEICKYYIVSILKVVVSIGLFLHVC